MHKKVLTKGSFIQNSSNSSQHWRLVSVGLLEQAWLSTRQFLHSFSLSISSLLSAPGPTVMQLSLSQHCKLFLQLAVTSKHDGKRACPRRVFPQMEAKSGMSKMRAPVGNLIGCLAYKQRTRIMRNESYMVPEVNVRRNMMQYASCLFCIDDAWCAMRNAMVICNWLVFCRLRAWQLPSAKQGTAFRNIRSNNNGEQKWDWKDWHPVMKNNAMSQWQNKFVFVLHGGQQQGIWEP